MKLKKWCLNLLFIIVLNKTELSFCKETENLELYLYIQRLLDQGYNLLQNKSLSEQEKFACIESIVIENFDIDWMFSYIVRDINKNDIFNKNFTKLREAYAYFLSSVYYKYTLMYKGEKVHVQNVHFIKKDFFVVKTELEKTIDFALSMDYILHFKNENYKIIDIITEGISLISSHKDMFSFYISELGVEELIRRLLQS